MDITLKLDAVSAATYATYYGFVDDGVVLLKDFVTSKILERIQNDVTEHLNRQAILNVTPILDVTSDNSQTTLRESIKTAKEAKVRKDQEPVIEDIKVGKIK